MQGGGLLDFRRPRQLSTKFAIRLAKLRRTFVTIMQRHLINKTDFVNENRYATACLFVVFS